MSKRAQTTGEEIANSLSHGVGFLLAIAAVPVLVITAVRSGGPAFVTGASIFGVTLVLLYLASTVYHALPPSRAKRIARLVDHGAIFLLIAGTYTPFTLGVLRGGWGWSIFGVIWALCLAGIGIKLVGGIRYPRVSLALYLSAGWMVLVAVKPLLDAVPPEGIAWLLAGGAAYTLGAVFYVFDRIPYCHFVWHLCVMTGSACHVAAVIGYGA